MIFSVARTSTMKAAASASAAARQSVLRAPLAATAISTRDFHSTRPARVKAGDALPDMAVLQEKTPGDKVNLAEEAKRCGKMIVVGVPAAFSPACSASHVPSYMQHPKAKEYGMVAVVSVNDVFVMKAWGESLDPAGKSGVRFFADPSGKFTEALDATFDSAAIFGNNRSKRYTLLVEDGVVKAAHVEPDNTGTAVSLADKVLGPA